MALPRSSLLPETIERSSAICVVTDRLVPHSPCSAISQAYLTLLTPSSYPVPRSNAGEVSSARHSQPCTSEQCLTDNASACELQWKRLPVRLTDTSHTCETPSQQRSVTESLLPAVTSGIRAEILHTHIAYYFAGAWYLSVKSPIAKGGTHALVTPLVQHFSAPDSAGPKTLYTQRSE